MTAAAQPTQEPPQPTRAVNRLSPAEQEARTQRHYARRSAKAQRRDARKRGATIGPPFTIADVITRDGDKCYLCGRTPQAPQLDHVVPIAAGGEHSLENSGIACPPCNNRKSDNIVAFLIGTRKPHYMRP